MKCPLRTVLTRISLLIMEELDEVIVARSDKCAEEGADPVDPVVALEGGGGDAGREGARWVERAAGVVSLGRRWGQ